ncbi:hypothetical protein ACFFLG_12840 [Shewanella indica]|uniref:hypothetical protein n=1 Tax=Shewanella indica TaxID=768528 RepID=UPI0012FEDAA5|nr:hypothetical protein [Shewanella indica]GHA91835.1 hypothetical protein GCM10007107_00700 [Shewanella indica]
MTGNRLLLLALVIFMAGLLLAAFDPLVGNCKRYLGEVVHSGPDGTTVALPDGRTALVEPSALPPATQVTIGAKRHLVSGIEVFKLKGRTKADTPSASRGGNTLPPSYQGGVAQAAK